MWKALKHILNTAAAWGTFSMKKGGLLLEDLFRCGIRPSCWLEEALPGGSCKNRSLRIHYLPAGCCEHLSWTLQFYSFYTRRKTSMLKPPNLGWIHTGCWGFVLFGNSTKYFTFGNFMIWLCTAQSPRLKVLNAGTTGCMDTSERHAY